MEERPPCGVAEALRGRGKRAQGPEGEQRPRADRERRSAARDAKHVVPAPRRVQIDDEERRTDDGTGERQVAPRAYRRAVALARHQIGDRRDDLARAGETAEEEIARDAMTVVARLDRGPLVVRVAAVAVDTTSGADEVEIDLANCLDHARIIRWHDAERSGPATPRDRAADVRGRGAGHGSGRRGDGRQRARPRRDRGPRLAPAGPAPPSSTLIGAVRRRTATCAR